MENVFRTDGHQVFCSVAKEVLQALYIAKKEIKSVFLHEKIQ